MYHFLGYIPNINDKIGRQTIAYLGSIMQQNLKSAQNRKHKFPDSNVVGQSILGISIIRIIEQQNKEFVT